VIGSCSADEKNKDRKRRLFLLAAGNVDFFEDAYLDRSDVEPIEDPGQAWNSLTIGACTEKESIDPSEVGYGGWTALAHITVAVFRSVTALQLRVARG
jgi:hypothetical protein